MAPSKRATSLTPRTCECYLYLYSKRDFGEVMKMGGLSWVIWAGTISNTFSEASAQIFCEIFFLVGGRVIFSLNLRVLYTLGYIQVVRL